MDSSIIDVNTVFNGVTYNRITLKQRIVSSVEGTYVSVVNTTAGGINVTITMNVEGQSCDSIMQLYNIHSFVL